MRALADENGPYQRWHRRRLCELKTTRPASDARHAALFLNSFYLANKLRGSARQMLFPDAVEYFFGHVPGYDNSTAEAERAKLEEQRFQTWITNGLLAWHPHDMTEEDFAACNAICPIREAAGEAPVEDHLGITAMALGCALDTAPQTQISV
ncbi:hypothetical protein MRB53_038490 [Persea americana]|nr:hypothetical protein MRB53_038490 [Persea americana]